MRFTRFADQCPEVARRFWVGVVRGCGFNLGRVGSCWENLRTFFCETRSGYRFFQTKCCAPKLAKHASMQRSATQETHAPSLLPSPAPPPRPILATSADPTDPTRYNSLRGHLGVARTRTRLSVYFYVYHHTTPFSMHGRTHWRFATTISLCAYIAMKSVVGP